MMYSSIGLQPSNQAIDKSIDNIFSWINRGSNQSDFQILALRNSDNTILYDSTKITSSDNFHTVPADTFDLSEQIKWQVVTWSGLQTANSQYAFIVADEPPTLTFTAPDFSSPPVVLDGQNYLFQMDYNQSQDISISQYRTILYDSTGTNIIEDTGFIYGFTPEYQATGMIREELYQIEGQAIAQDGLQCTTGKQSFSIAAYDIPETIPTIEVTANNCNASITVDWADLKLVTAETTGTYSFVSGKFDLGLLLDASATVTYNESVLGATNNLSGWFKFPYEVDGDFITFGASGVSIGFDYDTQRFYINNNGDFTYSPQWGMYTWEDFGDTTGEDWAGDCRNPGFDPIELTGHWFWFSTNNTNQLVAYFDDQFIFNITDSAIVDNFDSITMLGKVLLDNIHAQNTSLTLAQIQSISLTEPQVWQLYTNWLANYENNLEAGNIYNNVPVIGWALKRKRIQDSLFTTLGTFDKDIRTYTDYTPVNNETYVYAVYSLSSEGEGLGLEGQATMNFFGWFLVSTDGSGEFLKFDSGLKDGIKTDAIKVNKDFYQYNNFTQYPTISYGKQRYKTSKIECFPYYFNNDIIVNDVDLLNTCDNFINDMKKKILKNSKGEIFFVNTKNFDYKYLDESSEQPFTIVFEWVEISNSI